MAGAAFGEVPVSLFVAGAVLGDVQVSLFVAGAALGECLIECKIGRKTLYFSIENARGGLEK